jgi:hypothetical protein
MLSCYHIFFPENFTHWCGFRYDPAFQDHELNTLDILRYKAGVCREFAKIFADLCQESADKFPAFNKE